jgi:hypothetical protein
MGADMIKTTKEQRIAIKRVFDRQPIYTTKIAEAFNQPISYKRFRSTAQPTFGCDGAIVLHWCGMWLCIERDGYCHT